jgi:hypothetical protein
MADAKDERNDILARAVSGEEVTAAKEYAPDCEYARFDVPDFDAACEMYKEGTGSAEDAILSRGSYRSIWNREKLAKVLALGGWDIVGGATGTSWCDGEGWLSVVARRVTRPVPTLPMRDVEAIMSLPRIAWTETMGATTLACARLGIDFTKATGVFWGQCLQRMMEGVVGKETRKYILTIDFDSVFDHQDIVRMWQIMETNPTVDALFPLQIGRDRETVLLSMTDKEGKRVRQVPAEVFRQEVVDCDTGHFGLSLIRTDALRRMPKPWFLGSPNDAGEWGDGRVDDDIHFWKALRAAGGRIACTPRVRIGHLQLVVTWPDENLRSKHQYTSVFNDEGRPSECASY